MKHRYYHLDVFTETRLQGNPLAVFPSSDGLSGSDMQKIAAELNLSETVFLDKPSSPNALARARIFTPRRELDFAGHPTIGASFVLLEIHGPRASFAIEENVGDVPIDVEASESGRVRCWLTTPAIHFAETLERAFAAQLLGLTESDFGSAPPQFLTAGSPLLFIELASPLAVDRAELQVRHLPQALGSLNAGGTFVFARKHPDRGPNDDVYSRMFAPQLGIPEDPATGGATGPLALYMLEYGLLPSGQELEFTSEQGVRMGRRSVLHVRVTPSPAGAPRIQVGGSAVVLSSCEMLLD